MFSKVVAMTSTIDHWIGGRLVPGTSGRTSPVHNPATGAVTAQVPLASNEEVDAVVADAVRASKEWRHASLSRRAAVVFKFRELLAANVAADGDVPTAIEMAGKRIRDLGFEQPDLRVGSITELPWPDGVFDFVIDRGTLSYLLLDEIAATVREVSRVLKPGGKFFSYYLFGWNSSDRELGEEFAPRSFRGFCGGRFAKSPTVTLLDAAMIHQLWEPLVIRQLRRHEVTVEGTGVVEEFFDVQAVTYLADSPGH